MRWGWQMSCSVWGVPRLPTRHALSRQDLVWCMYEAADECWEQARVAGSKVTVLSDYEEALVLGNGELLRRAISNLISNALKYGGESGPVEVSLQQVGKDWEVSVRDFGPGIPEVERERLFQRFSRLPSAVQRGLPGIGLGLAMVKTVAERHRGSIRAEFPKDGGSRFRAETARHARLNPRMRTACSLILPAHYRQQDFLDFHRRDAQEVAEHVTEHGLDKGLVWAGHPACLSFRFRADCVEVALAVDGAVALDDTALKHIAQRMLGLTQGVEGF